MSIAESVSTLSNPVLSFRGIDPENGNWRVSVLTVRQGAEYTERDPLLRLTHERVNDVVSPILIHDEERTEFFRYDLSIPRDEQAKTVSYQIGGLPAYRIHIPGTHESPHCALTSCNGIFDPEKAKELGGISPMWDDLMEAHNRSPLDLMIGGGDQIYCDEVWSEDPIRRWRALPKEERITAKFTPEIEQAVDRFYLNSYLEHYNERSFRDALASIPSVNTWDDHDIYDGFGSYDPDEQNSPIFQGIYEVAKKYYLLFQHLTTEDRAEEAGLFGARGFHQIQTIDDMALCLIDTRAERTLTQIVSEESYDEIFSRIDALPEDVKHLMVVLSVPIVYPAMEIGEVAMDVYDYIRGQHFGRHLFDGDSSDGDDDEMVLPTDRPDFSYDLRDLWSSRGHHEERAALIQRLQEVAKAKGVRVTFLSGDVHAAALGILQNPNGTPPENDPHYMAQIISSAIGNAPPPGILETYFTLRNLNDDDLDDETEAYMKRVREQNGRDTERFLFHRNWCEFSRNEDSLAFAWHVEGEDGNPNRIYEAIIPALSLNEVAVADESKCCSKCVIL